MYELQDINPELVTNFYKAMAKVFKKEDGYDLLSKTIKDTMLILEPEMPLSILHISVDMLIQNREVMLMLYQICFVGAMSGHGISKKR